VKLQPILDTVLTPAVEKGVGDSTLSHEAQCLTLEMDQVSAALTCLDIVSVHKHILSCVMLYQTIKWTTSEPDSGSMDQVTNAVRAILHIRYTCSNDSCALVCLSASDRRYGTQRRC
jgi:hypothetical protein